MKFKQIEEYMKLSRDERRKHLKLEENCVEIGGNSSSCRNLLAWHLGTTVGGGKIVHLCHACHNAKCSNPSHLYWGTPQDNVADTIENGNFGTMVSRKVNPSNPGLFSNSNWTCAGTVWVNDGKISKRVTSKEIEKYLVLGWNRGRTAQKEKLSSCSGTFWVNREGQRMRVQADSVCMLLENGWNLGKNQDKTSAKKFPTRQAYAESQKLPPETLLLWRKAIDSVDTMKFGFIGKIAKKMNCSHTHVRRVLNTYFPEIQSFTRKSSSN